MIIGGLQKLTLIDYPGKLACIVFTSGCNFRCKYCYNKVLVDPKWIKENEEIQEKEIFDFLKQRKDKLEAVVITGGEPTLHADLKDFILKIKKMGYLVKLDSNGTNPEALEKIIDLVDYIAMDIKAPLTKEKYSEITQVDIDVEKLKKSIELIQNRAKDYEFRTTMEPKMTKEDILDIVKDVKGSKKYYLQEFKTTNTLIDNTYENKKGLLKEDLEDIIPLLKESFPVFDIR